MNNSKNNINIIKSKSDKIFEKDKIILVLKMIKEKYNEKNIIEIQYKILFNNSMLIYLFYFPKTKINFFYEKINFLIILDEQIKNPELKCLSNFMYPTIFDNKNFFELLIKKNEYIFDEIYQQIVPIIQEILKKIPLLIKHLFFNIQIRTLIEYGKYYEGNEYEINDFMQNDYLKFFNVIQFINKNNKENRYIIITDTNLLFFKPNDNIKNKAILIHSYNIYYDLKSFEKKIFHKKINKDSIILEFNNDDNNIEIVLKNDNNNEIFIKCLENKKKSLKERYDIIINNNTNKFICNYLDLDGKKYKTINKIHKSDFNEINNLVQYKEKIYELFLSSENFKENEETKDFVNSLTKELIVYYEKIIELKSAFNEDYSNYLNKMKKLIDDKY
jgi:hypothetical protein